jgi:hypothetical protein
LKNSAVFVPAGGFRKLLEDCSKEALEVQLLVHTESEHEPGEEHPEPIYAGIG